MARIIKTQLREVKPVVATPHRKDVTRAPHNADPYGTAFTDVSHARKWFAAVAWLRRGKKSKWLLDNVAPAKWRDVFDDEGKASAQA